MDAIEALVTRAVTAAVRELARDLLPRWLAKRVSPPVDKPVHTSADAGRVARARQLVELWSDPDAHADWCCLRGCTWPNAQHIEGAVHEIISGTAAVIDCPALCSCEVDNFVAPLREAIA